MAAYFSNELPTSEDYGTPEYHAWNAKLQKIIAEKLGRTEDSKQDKNKDKKSK